MIPHKVQIIAGDGRMVVENVMAVNHRDALICVLENIKIDHPIWQSPGWNVQTRPIKDAFLVQLKGGVS